MNAVVGVPVSVKSCQQISSSVLFFSFDKFSSLIAVVRICYKKKKKTVV